MIKTLVMDCFNLGIQRIYNGEKCYKGVSKTDKEIELENGVWLKAVGDGRFYKDDDDCSRWAVVVVAEFDEKGEFIQSIQDLGYTEL